ncbi:hypothetical protein C8J57DRAFT_1231838 [Mycena rebaudengoi]|nr:hypothetical protein C8J57DRAFT_1231838 [Mycena rebaudengoi]
MKINRRASEQGPMGDEIGGGNVIDGKENGRAIDGKELRVGQEMGWEGRIRKENAENTRRGSDTAKSADAREDRRPVMTQRSDRTVGRSKVRSKGCAHIVNNVRAAHRKQRAPSAPPSRSRRTRRVAARAHAVSKIERARVLRVKRAAIRIQLGRCEECAYYGGLRNVRRKFVGRYRDQLRGALIRGTASIKIQMGQVRGPAHEGMPGNFLACRTSNCAGKPAGWGC